MSLLDMAPIVENAYLTRPANRLLDDFGAGKASPGWVAPRR
ncbi:hypothetical protein [Cupriavidus sp. UYPR2.512]|nr:hypothetical protein [Cupriavidus sp. UYPR2.512]